MSKNIVICCDGTGNQFGDYNSNVVKLYRAMDLANPRAQVAYYHPGIGTMGAPAALTAFTALWTKVCGLLFAFGIMEDIGDCYRFLMDTYEPGDRVFLFGFSRGAYTARALAGLVHMYGLLRKGNSALIRYILRMYRTRTEDEDGKFRVAGGFKRTFAISCPIHFVGVWDTVSSVGWWRSVRLAYSYTNPDISVFRQAVSIDERRCYFWQNLFKEPPVLPTQNVLQVWFPGVHSDIGGSYSEAQSGLSKITLKWLMDEATTAGLIVDAGEKDLVLGELGQGYVKESPVAQIHDELRKFRWQLAEILPRRHYDMATRQTSWIVPFGRPRRIYDGANIHSSVLRRKADLSDYRPPNLPRQYKTIP